MKNKNLFVILLIIIVGGLSFYAGMKYQQGKVKFPSDQFPRSRNIQNGTRTISSGNFRPVAGEIIAIDDKSLTVKTNDGSSRIVILSEKTVFNKTEEGSKDDIKVGDNINVFGIQNTDGSVTAQNVQIGSMFRFRDEVPLQTEN